MADEKKKSLYPTEVEALAAPGEIVRHYNGGIYRILHRDVIKTENVPSSMKRSKPSEEDLGVVYEHLWPDQHRLFWRQQTVFFGKLDNGTLRFTPVKFRPTLQTEITTV